MIKKAFFTMLLMGIVHQTAAQTSVQKNRNSLNTVPIILGTALDPEMTAVRVDEQDVHLDGLLNESIWYEVPVATGFTQNFPKDGNPATERTEVRVLYTGTEMIIGFIAFESSPDSIMAPLFRRDGDEASDWVYVGIDSYNDKRTAFVFAVNPRGVQKDVLFFDDTNEDVLWNAIWEAKTDINSNGWSAEIKIPFSQLRFSSENANQSWGINFGRIMAKNGEEVFWAPTPQNDDGVVSKFGRLKGIKNLKEPRRLEITPYFSGSLTRIPAVESLDPYYNRDDFDGGMGGDIKYGLTSDLTLTATVNPDFGQVEADPAVINLTANESFFSERRPFFLEGSDIFQFGNTRTFSRMGNPITFYSRRIGRAPQGGAIRAGLNPSYQNKPDFTTIAAAVKLSGKTHKGWSIGILDAYTLEETANYIASDERENSVAAEPATNYMVSRIKKDFRNGNTYFGGFGSAVNRSIGSTYFKDYLRNSAYLGGLDFEHNFANNNWVTSGVISFSHIKGSESAIELAQRSPVRYYDRIDSDHLSVNPSKTSLSGFATEVSIQKKAGKDNWLTSLTYAEVSPGYETNDLGFMNRADYRAINGGLVYVELHPSLLQYYEHWFFTGRAWNYDGDNINHNYGIGGFMRFKNLWTVNYNINYNAPQVLDRVTRGGPIMKRPVDVNFNLNFNTNQNKKLSFHAGTYHRKDVSGEFDHQFWGGFTYLPTTYMQISFSPEFIYQKDTDQYIVSIQDANATNTYGNRYVFSDILQNSIVANIRLNWTFSPTMSLQTYIRPFIYSANYSNFKEFSAAGTFDFGTYGEEQGTLEEIEGNYLIDPDGISGPSSSFTIQNPDFNFRSIQGNAVFRWEYRPGSTIFLVWQQQRDNTIGMGNFDLGRDLDGLFSAKPVNVFLVKVSYWFGS